MLTQLTTLLIPEHNQPYHVCCVPGQSITITEERKKGRKKERERGGGGETEGESLQPQTHFRAAPNLL